MKSVIFLPKIPSQAKLWKNPIKILMKKISLKLIWVQRDSDSTEEKMFPSGQPRSIPDILCVPQTQPRVIPEPISRNIPSRNNTAIYRSKINKQNVLGQNNSMIFPCLWPTRFYPHHIICSPEHCQI